MATIHRLQRPEAAPLGAEQSIAQRRSISAWRHSDHYTGLLSEILAQIQRIPRSALVHLTTHLIDHLDQFDANPDDEDDDLDNEHDGHEPDDYR